MTVDVLITVSVSQILLTPKSANFTCLFLIKMFCGLISRCQILFFIRQRQPTADSQRYCRNQKSPIYLCFYMFYSSMSNKQQSASSKMTNINMLVFSGNLNTYFSLIIRGNSGIIIRHLNSLSIPYFLQLIGQDIFLQA